MAAQTEQIELDIPIQALALVCAEYCRSWVAAEPRGFAGAIRTGGGVTVGSDHYEASTDMVDLGNGVEACVRLTKRPNAFSGGGDIMTVTLPCRSIGRIVATFEVILPAAVAA